MKRSQHSVPLNTNNSAALFKPQKKATQIININSHRQRVIRRDWDDEVTNGDVDSIETRLDATYGQPIIKINPPIVERSLFQDESGSRFKEKSLSIKKRRSGGQSDNDTPPTPRGCDWSKTDDGWNLWRIKWEKDPETGKRVKKIRYAGSLSRDAWRVMKDYDDETVISIIGQQLRRHGQR